MPNDMNMGGHDDAPQDEAMLKSDLTPVIQEIGQRLADLEDIVYRMVTAFESAVNGQKMQGLKSGISEKFGPDIESLGPVFSDIYGGDLADELVQALGGQDGDLMEKAGQMLDGLKGKLGKYIPQPAQEPPAPDGEPASVSVEVGGTVDPSKDEPATDALDKPLSAAQEMIKKVQALRTGRKTA